MYQKSPHKSTRFFLAILIAYMLCSSTVTATLDQQIEQFKGSLNALKEKLVLLAQKQIEVKAKLEAKAVPLTNAATALFDEYKISARKNEEPFLTELRLKWTPLDENEKLTIKKIKGNDELLAKNFVRAMTEKPVEVKKIVIQPAPVAHQLTEEEIEQARDAAKTKEIEALLKNNNSKESLTFLNTHFGTQSTSVKKLPEELITKNNTRINVIIELLTPKKGASKITSLNQRRDLEKEQITREQQNKKYTELKTKKSTDTDIANYLLNQILEKYKPKKDIDEW